MLHQVTRYFLSTSCCCQSVPLTKKHLALLFTILEEDRTRNHTELTAAFTFWLPLIHLFPSIPLSCVFGEKSLTQFKAFFWTFSRGDKVPSQGTPEEYLCVLASVRNAEETLEVAVLVYANCKGKEDTNWSQKTKHPSSIPNSSVVLFITSLYSYPLLLGNGGCLVGFVFVFLKCLGLVKCWIFSYNYCALLYQMG